jgi:hypothetical protein
MVNLVGMISMSLRKKSLIKKQHITYIGARRLYGTQRSKVKQNEEFGFKMDNFANINKYQLNVLEENRYD